MPSSGQFHFEISALPARFQDFIDQLLHGEGTVARSLRYTHASSDPLVARFRANAEPRLEADALDVGGWGFRAFLSLPLIVALIATMVMGLA